eukprot:scaffold162_cov176-Amphora_coffeaeformis.AAC.22
MSATKRKKGHSGNWHRRVRHAFKNLNVPLSYSANNWSSSNSTPFVSLTGLTPIYRTPYDGSSKIAYLSFRKEVVKYKWNILILIGLVATVCISTLSAYP